MTEQLKNLLTFKRIIFVAFGICVFVPLVFPMGLPISVSDMTQEYFNYIESLPAGSKVLVLGEYDLGAAGNHMWFIDMWKHFRRNKLKVVALHTSTMVATAEKRLLDTMGFWNLQDYEYGVDWVYLGYVPGGETAMVSFHDDFQSIAVADYKGTPASELPLLQEFQDYRDFDLVIVSCWDYTIFARQWVTTPETPTICMVDTYVWSSAQPFYPETFEAMMNGMKGAAEYEILLEIPGRAISSSDALTLTMLVLFFTLLAAQVDEYMIRKKVVRKEVA